MQILPLERDSGRWHLALVDQSKDSAAIRIPKESDNTTVVVSSVSGGSVLVEYTLSLRSQVVDDSAIWHPWSVGSVDDEGGTGFDGPTIAIRVVITPTDAAVPMKYTIEVLA